MKFFCRPLFKDFGIVVVVQNEGRILEFVGNGLPDTGKIFIGDLFAGKALNFAGLGVVGALVGDPAAGLEDGKRLGIGEDIAAHEKPGIIFQSKEVRDGGDNVEAGDRIVDNLVFHAGLPDNKGGFKELKRLVNLMADEGAVILDGEAVGIVVSADDEDSVFKLSCLIKLIDEILHGILKLKVAGKIGAAAFGEIEVCNFFLMRLGLVVAGKGIELMSGYSHVIGVELILIDVFGQGQLHHFKVGFGPGLTYVETVAVTLIDVADVRMGLVSLIVCIGVVMVRKGIGIAELFELVTHAEGHIVVRGQFEGTNTGFGDQAGAGDVLTVCG